MPFLFLPYLYRLIGCLALLCLGAAVCGQEICGNCIDDDGNGLVDCYDPACCGTAACKDAFYDCTEPQLDNCGVVYPVSISQQWVNNTPIDTRRTPVAGDVDGDGQVEILVSGRATQGLLIVNGSTGITEQRLDIRFSTFFDSPTIADIQGDGYAEIFAVNNQGKLVRFDYNTATQQFEDAETAINSTWAPSAIVPNSDFVVSITDFNGDGFAELVAANSIYSAHTGALLATAPGGLNAPYGVSSGGLVSFGNEAFPAFADVLPNGYCTDCSGLELVCGPVVYAVNLANNTVSIAADLRSTTTGVPDGATAVADWDNDGALDVIVNGAGGLLYVYNPRTKSLINGPREIGHGTYATSHPSVGDFDNDGLLELACAGNNYFHALDNDFSLLWDANTNDNSSKTTASLYDLNGDLKFELIYLDEDGLHVWDAATGERYAFVACGSGTRTNYPIVANVDDDNEANIICVCRDGTPFPGDKATTGYLRVFRSGEYPWLPSRKVMNQHSYFVTNINDDLTLCQEQQNHAKSAKLNSYLSQSTYYGSVLGYPVPDISSQTVEAEVHCTATEYEAQLMATACNRGNAATPDTLFHTLYRKNGGLWQALETQFLLPPIAADSCFQVSYTAPFSDSTVYRIRFNDKGNGNLDSLQTGFDECDTSNNVVLVNVAPIQPEVNLTHQPPKCHGASNGKVYSSATSQLEAPLQFVWSTGFTGDTLVAPAGEYAVNVTDQRNCQAQATMEVAEPPALQWQVQLTNVGCREGEKGRITVAASGGTADYSYTLNGSGANSSGIFNDLDTGEYAIAVRDANACIRDSVVQISTDGTRIYTQITAPDTLCSDSAWVTLEGSPAGGVWGPEKWVQTNGRLNTQAIDTSAITVWYGIAGSCGDTTTQEIQIITRANATFNLPPTFCLDDQPQLAIPEAAGGQWSGSGMQDNGTFNPAEAGPGIHQIAYSQHGFCPAVQYQDVEVIAPPTISFQIPDSICALETLSLAAYPPGGNWSGAGVDATRNTFDPAVAGPGQNWLYYETSGICLAIDSVMLTVYPPVKPTLPSWDSLCFAPADTLLVAQPDGGRWEGPGITTNGWFRGNTLGAGSYLLKYTPPGRCAVPDSQLIHIAQPLISANTIDSVPCAGDRLPYIAVSVSGGNAPYNFHWENYTNTQGDTAYNVPAGQYQVQVQDALGCELSVQRTVLEPSVLQATVVSTQDITCHGYCDGIAQVHLAGGWPKDSTYSYQLNGTDTLHPQVLWQNLCAASYQLQVTSALGCQTQAQWQLVEPEKPTLSLAIDTAYCDLANGAARITEIAGGSAPFAFQWDQQGWDIPLHGADSGSYRLQLRDAQNCSLDTTIYIPHARGVTANASSVPLLCYGDNSGAIRVTGRGVYPPFLLNDTVTVNNGSFTVDLAHLAASTYTVQLKDEKQCTWDTTLTVQQPNPLKWIPTSKQTLCYQDTVLLWYQAEGGMPPYQFFRNGERLHLPDTLFHSGTHRIQVADANGCRTSGDHLPVETRDSFAIQVPDELAGCPDSTFVVEALAAGGSGMVTWLWQDSLQQNPYLYRMAATADTIKVQGIDEVCQDTLTKHIPAQPFSAPDVNIISGAHAGCVPLTVDFTLSNSALLQRWSWNMGDGTHYGQQKTISHSYNRSGWFYPSILGYSALGCAFQWTSTDSIAVHPKPRVWLQASPQRLSNWQNESTLSITSMPVLTQNIRWRIDSDFTENWFLADSNITQLKLEFPENKAKYYVNIKGATEMGCIGEAQTMVVVDDVWEIYAPNTITVNHDGLNEAFGFYVSEFPNGPVNWSVYNRWGERIFTSTQIDDRWDGSYQGTAVQQGAYVWKITLTHDNAEITFTGTVTVLR